jgi:hypothetical protein
VSKEAKLGLSSSNILKTIEENYKKSGSSLSRGQMKKFKDGSKFLVLSPDLL